MSKLAKYKLSWTEKRAYLPGAICVWLPAARRKSQKDAFTSQGRRRAQKAPIYKPSYMTDKQFKDALDGMDKDGKKRLSDALKKIAPRTDKNGQGLMPFASNKNASSSVQNVMNKYNTLREKAENKINELQKIKSDNSKNWKEKNDAYEQWSDIYNSITALNNDFANFDKYDESRKKMAEKDMAYHIKRLEEDINR